MATNQVVSMKQLLESGVHFGHQTRRWNPKMKRFIFTERNGIYIIDLQQSLSYIDRAYEFIKETVAHGGSVMFVGTKKQAQEAIAEQATRVGSAVWIIDTKKEHIAVGEAHKLGIPVVAILDTNCDPDEVDYKIPGNDDAIRSVTLLTRVIADAVADGLMARVRTSQDGDDKPEGLATDEPLAEWEQELLRGQAAEGTPAAGEVVEGAGAEATAPVSAAADTAATEVTEAPATEAPAADAAEAP